MLKQHQSRWKKETPFHDLTFHLQKKKQSSAHETVDQKRFLCTASIMLEGILVWKLKPRFTVHVRFKRMICSYEKFPLGTIRVIHLQQFFVFRKVSFQNSWEQLRSHISKSLLVGSASIFVCEWKAFHSQNCFYFKVAPYISC